MFHRVVLSVERGRIIFHRVALCVVWGCCFFRACGGAGVCAGENSPCSTCWQQNGIKLSQQEQNAPNWEILGVLGEFCTGTGGVPGVRGEFCTGSGGVPVLLLVVAGQNSPCSTCWQQKRDKTLPARAKRAKLGDFGRAGRVLYRNWHRVARAGRVLYRNWHRAPQAGRVLYRNWWRAGRAGRVLYRNRGPQLARGECCADCPAAFGRRWVRSGHNKTARRVAGRGWSGRRESNPPLKLGKLPFYR